MPTWVYVVILYSTIAGVCYLNILCTQPCWRNAFIRILSAPEVRTCACECTLGAFLLIANHRFGQSTVSMGIFWHFVHLTNKNSTIVYTEFFYVLTIIHVWISIFTAITWKQLEISENILYRWRVLTILNWSICA